MDSIVFDAYGTLFDVAAPAREAVDDAELADRIAIHWRGRQLEYAWTDTALGRPTDFWAVTRRALQTALEVVDRGDDAGLRDRLLEVYSRVEAYGDAADTLAALHARGLRTIVYSNADQSMLETSVDAAGLRESLDEVLSVDGGGIYKPHAGAYRHLAEALELDPPRTRYVSSNAWDVAGAGAVGFRACWVNRAKATYPFGEPGPEEVVDSLAALV